MTDLEVVNAVGSGGLGVELDLERLAEEVGEPMARYNPEKYPGVYLRLEEDGALVILYRTGKYIVTGADSEEQVFEYRDRVLALFSDLDVIEERSDDFFSIQNLVCSGDLGFELNLNALAIGLGLENTEYEPEQFPGLVYRSPDLDSVVLLFASGRIVVTGSKSFDDAVTAFDSISSTVSSLQDT